MNNLPKPLPQRCLVELESQTTQLAGGLIIPESAREKSTKATVVAVGPEAPLDPAIEVGTRVLIASHAGVEIHIEKKVYHLVRYQDVYAVI